MAPTSPHWLTERGGSLKLGSDGATWYVVFGEGPQYSLTAVPVESKVGCVIKQTINGRRVPSIGTFATIDEAIRGGLEDLRKDLGWA